MLQTTEILPALLNQKQVAEYLGVSTKKLEKDRLDGDGIPFVKIGRQVRYKAADLNDHVNRNTFSSTSENAGA